MGIMAERSNINMVGTRVDITKIMELNPRRVGEIKVEFTFPSDHQYSDQERQLLENTARACPVSNSLSSELKQTIIFKY